MSIKNMVMCIGVLMYMPSALGIKGQFNEMQKIFHHTIENCGESVLEFEKIAFYFGRVPDVQTLDVQEKEGNIKEHVIFFPMAVVKSAECKKSFDSINMLQKTAKEKSYSVHLQVVDKPMAGIKMVVAYDTRRVKHELQSFEEAVNSNKGVVLRLYNTAVIEAIKNKGTEVLRVAHGHKKKEVIIDCGHGGADAGTHGHFNLDEKSVTLDIGLQVAHILRARGYRVVLTREADVDVPLDLRTSLANKHNQAKLFVSIHANNAGENARGIETFCLRQQLFKYVGQHAHNIHAQKGLEFLYNESMQLARSVQNHTVSAAQGKQSQVLDRGIKHSVAQVLLGTTMPAALIEVGFLSNKQEAALINNKEYRKTVAQGICEGIEAYYKQSVG